jgi:hypothetical protein
MVYSDMTEMAPFETKNLDRYGDAELAWSRAHDALAAVPTPDITHFLGTCRPDGTPHAAGIGAQWLDGDLYFTSSPAARKARDLAANPRCTISARLPGIDLVLNGTAARVTDPETLEQVASGFRAGAAAAARLPVHVPHRRRGSDHGAVRRDPLAVPALAADEIRCL